MGHRVSFSSGVARIGCNREPTVGHMRPGRICGRKWSGGNPGGNASLFQWCPQAWRTELREVTS